MQENVAEGLTREYGGAPEKWFHAKGNAVLDTSDGDRPAEIHWFANEQVGQVKHKIKRWLDES